MSYATAFLSHNLKDASLVEAVADALGQRGIIPWLAQDNLLMGKELNVSLYEAINGHPFVVLFLSQEAIDSKWVQDELQLALQRENNNKTCILPVFLGEPVKLVKNCYLLKDTWLHADGSRVNRLYFTPPDEKDLKEQGAYLAEKLAKEVFRSLGFNTADKIAIVIDQRGSDYRVGKYWLIPPNIASEKMPTLVFRPDRKQRTYTETLTGKEWCNFINTVEDSITSALGNLRKAKSIWLLGDGQLGIFFFLGQLFNRTSSCTLYCFNNRSKTTFNNENQTRLSPLQGGNPNCNVYCREKNGGYNILPPRIEPGKRYNTIALFIGKRDYLKSINEHLDAEGQSTSLVFIPPENREFKDSKEVMKLARDVVALLLLMTEQHSTQKVRLYCDLPNNVLPIIAANLTHHVITKIEFMDYQGGNKKGECQPIDGYKFLEGGG